MKILTAVRLAAALLLLLLAIYPPYDWASLWLALTGFFVLLTQPRV